MTMPRAYRDHLDSLEGFVELCCPACGEDEAVPTTWAGEQRTDSYLSACFLCGTVFDLDWDEYGGDTLQSSICHEIRADDERLPARGGRRHRTNLGDKSR